MPQGIQLFAGRQIRTYWDDNEEEYYFCIIDVVETLTDSNDPKQYIKRMRQRDSELNSVWGTICTPPPSIHLFRWQTASGKLCTNEWYSSHHTVHPIQESRTLQIGESISPRKSGPDHPRGDGYTRIQGLLSQGQLPEDVKDYLLKSWAEIKTYEACTAYGLLHHCGL